MAKKKEKTTKVPILVNYSYLPPVENSRIGEVLDRFPASERERIEQEFQSIRNYVPTSEIYV